MPDPHPSAVSGAFGLPFSEQIAFFRRKLGNLVPTRRWDDLTGAAHDEAFMVAGATKADLLADLAAAVDKAISEGRGIDEFRRDFRSIVAKNGWTGWTGEGSVRGEAWRVGVIYRTNAYTSYSAGRFAQLTEGNFPLWVYRHGGSLEPRLQHLGWNGLYLPPTHEFWRWYYPPSDWGCSCYVLGARSEAAARRLGGDPSKKLPAGWKRIDPKTGTLAGIGKGWGYAPGASVVAKVSALARSLNRLPEELANGVLREWQERGMFLSWAEAAKQSPDVEDLGWPLVRLPDDDAAAIGSTSKLALLSPSTFAKQAARHPELTWSDWRLAQNVVTAPTARIQDGPASMVYIQEQSSDQAGGHVLVVSATRSGAGLFIKSFRRLSRDEARRDREIARLLSKGEGRR